MAGIGTNEWLAICGLGALWLGWQVFMVAGFPNAFRARREPPPNEDPSVAFQRFWAEQYRFFGLTLSIGGVLLTLVGALR
jgi:hypothetical protein